MARQIDRDLTNRGGNSPNKTVRSSNIELFRIVTMFMIIAHHYVVNSGLTTADGPIYADPLSWRSLFLLIFGAWGKTGINCFVMITGYFMCKSHFTVRKFAKLFLEVMFYHIVIALIFLAAGAEKFTVLSFIIRILPVSEISHGFGNSFLVFYLFIPFLTILVQNMNERQHILLLLWCGFTYIFMGTVPKLFVTMNYVSWFSVIFVIASYIRLYPKQLYKSTRLWGRLTLLVLAIDISSIIACAWLSAKTGKTQAYAFVQDSNTFLAVVTSICAFLFFKNLKIPYSKFINTVASTCFG